jgi:site-specific recombinase XerD
VDSLLAAAAVNDVGELRRGFVLSLRARNRSEKTIKSYVEAVDLYRDFALRNGMPTAVDKINRDHIETFIADQVTRWKPKTAQIRYGSLMQFFKWCTEEGEITVSPMVNMKPPSVPEVPVAVVDDDDLKKLMKTCASASFEDRRDSAILRLFIACGLRLSEVADLTMADVIWEHDSVNVTGKGARPRTVVYSPKTGQALDKYDRARKSHPFAYQSSLWLGTRGPLTANGIAQMLRRRCTQAGIAQLHPHQIRHTAAHVAARGGLSDSDMMRTFGWRSRQMLIRYGASAADERAREAYRKMAPGDRI